MLIKKRCTYCGKHFEARTSKTRYCSHTCNQKHYKEKEKKARLKAASTRNKTPVTSFQSTMEDIKLRDYLSIEESALLLNVSRSTIKRLIDTEVLLCFNIFSRVVIRKIDIENYCKSELQKPRFNRVEPRPISRKAKHFNKDNYYFMGEIEKHYHISLKTVERHVKSNGIERVKKGRFNYVLKTDIRKIFGAPTKKLQND